MSRTSRKDFNIFNFSRFNTKFNIDTNISEFFSIYRDFFSSFFWLHPKGDNLEAKTALEGASLPTIFIETIHLGIHSRFESRNSVSSFFRHLRFENKINFNEI